MKNSGDHAQLSTSCAAYSASGSGCSATPPSRHTSHEAAPIAAYSAVHATGKAQLGGVHHGLRSEGYHVFSCGRDSA